MPQNASRRGYLLGAATLVILLTGYLAHAPWPALAAIAVLGLGAALALVRGATRPAT